MKITFDPTNLRSEMVGTDHGITKAELRQATPLAWKALAQFRRLVDAGTYGFPNLPADKATITAIQKYAASQRGKFDTICVAGIGGSALGAWAIDCALRGQHPIQAPFSTKNPRLVILDNVDPDFITSAVASMNPRKTLVIPIAKSGATAETMSVFLILKAWLEASLGKKASGHIAVVTSEGRGDLKVLATHNGYATFHLPDNVGGRFSVLSAVGLLPAALTGVDIGKLCSGAAAMTKLCWEVELSRNPALSAALHHYLSWTKHGKTIQVAFPYVNRLWGAAFWFRQLWAESLGKRTDRAGNVIHTGQTPIAALGTTDQHSQVQLYMEGPHDKLYTFWTVKNFATPGTIPAKAPGYEGMDYLAGQTLAKLIDAEQRATGAALTENQRPNCAFTLDKIDAEHLGAFFQLLEFETAFAGEMLNINAFDQEGVELGKKFTFGLMGRKGFADYKKRFANYEAQRKAAAKA
jgi:glucose-6-phosphate isomerase